MDRPASVEHDEVQATQAARVSTKAKTNEEIIKLLHTELEANPEADLTTELRRITRQINPLPKSLKPPPKKMDFCQDTVYRTKEAEIIYPLSDEATSLLMKYTETGLDQTKSLLKALKRMITVSEKLWQSSLRGAVLKCNDSIAAKIMRGNYDYTEYTTLQYLELHAPDVPAPRPHGLIKFGRVRIMLMTYFPMITLERAWPDLTRENKLSIQARLEECFRSLRSLKSQMGSELGGVRGEGVQDFYMDDHKMQHVNTILAFEDFLFSVDTYPPSPAWTKFLREFLPVSEEELVFTHGDLRPANIMVELDANNQYIVTGIIDWEKSGFYPDYFESTQVLHLFDRNVENDWFQYLPCCISPMKYPERFLVERLWALSIGYSAIKKEKFHTTTSYGSNCDLEFITEQED